MRALKSLSWGIVAFFVAGPLASGQSLSDTEEVVPLEAIASRNAQFTGWDRYLGLGLTGTLNENKNVVGKDDGQSTTLGLKIEGAVDFKEGQQQWLNSLNVFVAYSRTPQLPNYLKSEDTLQLESLYKYYLESTPWLGFFARVSLDTALFPGYDNRFEITTYRKLYSDGTEELLDGERIRLTDKFRPMRFRESLGSIAQLIDNQLFQWDVKLGLGMRQILADGQFVIDNDSSTAEIELRELANYEKAGYEFGTEISGQTEDKRVTYKFRGDVLFPFYESPSVDDDRSNFDKRIIDINGSVSFHLLEWASLDYLLKVVRDPDIIDQAQLSQTYLFSVNKMLTPRRTH
ncbi:MAG: hypothetical protein ACOH5I_12150 [Oligoflexus sp.]